MKGAETLHEGLTYARRIGDAVLLCSFLAPGLGLILSPLMLVTFVALLPRKSFRVWLTQFDNRQPVIDRARERATARPIPFRASQPFSTRY